ncbi:MAG TPA: hypothetical protein VIE91_03310 [Methylophilaceae bacterium]|jgi:hypothetical protein
MKVSAIWKLFLIGALATCLQIPAALAGATNSGDNTSATPGDSSSSVKTPADADSDTRKGTSNTKNMKTPKDSHRKATGKPDDSYPSNGPANPSDGSSMPDPGNPNNSGYK